MRALHVNFEPPPRRLHFAKGHRLPIGIVVDREMVARAEAAAVAHRLRNNNLAATGHGGDHGGKQCLLGGGVKRGSMVSVFRIVFRISTFEVAVADRDGDIDLLDHCTSFRCGNHPKFALARPAAMRESASLREWKPVGCGSPP